MAKIAAFAAVAISLAAAIPTGGGSLTLLAAGLGTSAATATAIAAGFSAAVAIGAGLLAKKPTGGGSQSDWSADPNASVPILIGRTGVAGSIVYRKGSGDADKNKYETINSVLSLGPVASYDTLFCDRKPVAFAGTSAIGSPYSERLWMAKQIGACPEPGILNTGVGNKPGLTPAHKMSGLAADQVTMLYDAKGKNTFTTEPQMLRVGHWVLAYDAREDSTYPGGSGPQRANDETTWQWSNNPYTVGVTWALGWHQNGKRRGGVGLRPDQIDIGSFVEAANIADLNGWTLGGEVTTDQDKWEVMKAILQAGGGEPIRDGAILSCIIQAPRVSIATIGAGDLIGRASIPRSRPRKERINGIIPKYRSEEHFWEQVAGTVARIDAFVAEDGGTRTQQIEYPLVQVETGSDASQPTQLAGYDVELSRERMPISLPLKLRWIGYRTGDCISCAITETGLVGLQLIIIKRSLDPATGAVTLTVRTEDPAKHARVFALTGDLPPATAFNRPDVPSDYVSEPQSRASYTLRAQTVAYPITSDDASITVAAFTGTLDDGRIIDFPAATIADLAPATAYVVLYDLAAGSYIAVPEPATTEIASSAYVQIRFVMTSNADGTYPTTPPAPGGDGGGGGGSGCVSDDSLVLLANVSRDGPGDEKVARDIVAGDWLWTQHEHTFEWGAYQVEAVSFPICTILAAGGYPDASADHPFGEERMWFFMETIGVPARVGPVMRASVRDAHTYMARHPGGSWKLCHNKTSEPSI